jgi:hypothetical protein
LSASLLEWKAYIPPSPISITVMAAGMRYSPPRLGAQTSPTFTSLETAWTFSRTDGKFYANLRTILTVTANNPLLVSKLSEAISKA